MKPTSKAVKDSRKRTGTKATSFAFTEAEKADVDGLAERLGVTRKEAVLRAVRAYEAGALTPQRAIAQIRELLDTLER